MKRKILVSLLIVSAVLLIGGCNEIEQSDAKGGSSDFNYEQWRRKIKDKRHPDLKTFSFDVIHEETSYKEGEIVKEFMNDSLIVTYYKTVWIGCELEGGLELEKKYLTLTYRPICPPSMESFVTEEAFVKFRFVILNKANFLNKKIKIESE